LSKHPVHQRHLSANGVQGRGRRSGEATIGPSASLNLLASVQAGAAKKAAHVRWVFLQEPNLGTGHLVHGAHADLGQRDGDDLDLVLGGSFSACSVNPRIGAGSQPGDHSALPQLVDHAGCTPIPGFASWTGSPVEASDAPASRSEGCAAAAPGRHTSSDPAVKWFENPIRELSRGEAGGASS
jgi:hypothetical protein